MHPDVINYVKIHDQRITSSEKEQIFQEFTS